MFEYRQTYQPVFRSPDLGARGGNTATELRPPEGGDWELWSVHQDVEQGHQNHLIVVWRRDLSEVDRKQRLKENTEAMLEGAVHETPQL